MTERQKKMIETYIPSQPDPDLEFGEFYMADSADRVMREPRYKPEKYIDFEMPCDDMDTHITGRKSKLVKKRKPGKCLYCLAPIPAGDYCLAEWGFIEEFGGNRPFRVYYCLDCVDDEIRSWQDDDYEEEAYRKWEERYERWKNDGRNT